MDRVATLALWTDSPGGEQVRLGQIRYLSDSQRPGHLKFRQHVQVPGGGTVILDSECMDDTGMLSLRVDQDGHLLLRAFCRWGPNDPPFLQARLAGGKLLTVQFVRGLLQDGGPELR